MIGRFAQIVVYKELTESYKFYRILLAGMLALAAYLYDRGSHSASTTGIILAIFSLILNGFPIIPGALKGLVRRKTNMDELVNI